MVWVFFILLLAIIVCMMELEPEGRSDSAYFGGGCFWCTEAIFKMLKGVKSVTPGYAGGHAQNPSYYDVVEGETGHAEVIRIVFDPKIIPYEDLLEVFWHTHDPTSLNKQGADEGTLYRSVILYTDEHQKQAAEHSLKQLEKDKEFKNPIVTEIVPLDKFYEAEDYHKNYYEKYSFEPYCQLVISPKLAHVREKYSTKLKDSQK